MEEPKSREPPWGCSGGEEMRTMAERWTRRGGGGEGNGPTMPENCAACFYICYFVYCSAYGKYANAHFVDEETESLLLTP